MPAKKARRKTDTRLATSASASLHKNGRDEFGGGIKSIMLGYQHLKSSLEYHV